MKIIISLDVRLDMLNYPRLNRNKLRKWLLEHPRLNPYNISFFRTYRTLTGFLRLKPDFIIIGFHKCGTTSFYDYLCQHQIGRAHV